MTARLSAAAAAGDPPLAATAQPLGGITLAQFLGAPVAGLRSPQVEAAAGRPDLTLRVIRDPAGKKLAEKLYETYIRRQDAGYDNFVEFLYNLDRMMSEHGGLAVRPEPEDDGARVAGRAEDSDEDDGYDDEPSEDEELELSSAADALAECASA